MLPTQHSRLDNDVTNTTIPPPILWITAVLPWRSPREAPFHLRGQPAWDTAVSLRAATSTLRLDPLQSLPPTPPQEENKDLRPMNGWNGVKRVTVKAKRSASQNDNDGSLETLLPGVTESSPHPCPGPPCKVRPWSEPTALGAFPASHRAISKENEDERP